LNLTYKQTEALEVLEDHDNGINELLFGGGAGGGKSALGCYWLAKMCILFPGTRWLMGRAKLKTLKDTTLQTFYEITKREGWDVLYHHTTNSHIIKFHNGSEIMLKDLFHYPSDPEYDELGSLEITGAFIDEVGQISKKCWDIVRSRCRYKLKAFCPHCASPTETHEVLATQEKDEYDEWKCSGCGKVHRGFEPKIMGSCNPTRNWVFKNFYNAHREKKLRHDRYFIQSLATDNPNVPRQYLESLRMLDQASRERLLYGNWDYEDDPSILCNFQSIEALWTNTYVGDYEGGGTYITADIALHGSDKFVIFVWYGFTIIDFRVMEKSTAPEVEAMIRQLAMAYHVPQYRIAYDADGLGSFLMGYLGGATPINNGGQPVKAPSEQDEQYFQKEVFRNIKAQMYFKLASLINQNKMYIRCDLGEYAEMLKEELAVIKNHSYGKDTILQVLPKEKVKELIGRSPDFSDAMAYRMLFALKVDLSTNADIRFYSNSQNIRFNNSN
jgi:hypothetical protein